MELIVQEVLERKISSFFLPIPPQEFRNRECELHYILSEGFLQKNSSIENEGYIVSVVYLVNE